MDPQCHHSVLLYLIPPPQQTLTPLVLRPPPLPRPHRHDIQKKNRDKLTPSFYPLGLVQSHYNRHNQDRPSEAPHFHFLFILKSIKDYKHVKIMTHRKRTETNLPHHFPCLASYNNVTATTIRTGRPRHSIIMSCSCCKILKIRSNQSVREVEESLLQYPRPHTVCVISFSGLALHQHIINAMTRPGEANLHHPRHLCKYLQDSECK